jgi:FAD/FMN-containing dehydrogenase
MATVTAALDESLAQLRDSIRGHVIVPGSDGYEQARRVWNGMIDRRPAAIVSCAGVADVRDAIRFAREHELVTAIRGGAHNVGGFATCDGGLVIDLAPMNGIRVDPAARRVRAEGGVRWGQLDHETQAFALATTGGLISTTGIAGLTLGGGYGWLGRTYGLACDNLVSADVVTADGDLVSASADVNADLFWGLRGGGGNFGVATSLEYRLHPVGPIVLGGAVFYPIAEARDFLRFWRVWRPSIPDELATMAALMNAPEAPFVPPELVGKPVIGFVLLHSGAVEAGERAIRPLRDFGLPAIDLVGPIPYVAQQVMFDPFYPHGVLTYWTTEHVNELSDELIETLLSRLAASPSPRSQLFIEHLEGAVGRETGGETAVSHRGDRYRILVLSLWDERGAADENVAWARASRQDVERFATGGVYLNYLADEGAERARQAYEPAKLERLRALKHTYDPDNFFRLNQNIAPA